MAPNSRPSGNGQEASKRFVCAAQDVLNCCYGCPQGGGVIRVRVRCRHRSVELSSNSVPAGGDPDGEGERLLQLLMRVAFSEEERAILRALKEDALAAPAISRRLREPSEGASTRLKILLTNLANRGVLELTRMGYKVADVRLLEVAREGDDSCPPASGGANAEDPEGEGEGSRAG